MGGKLLTSVKGGENTAYPMEPNFSAALRKAWGAASIFPNTGGMPAVLSAVAPCTLILK